MAHGRGCDALAASERPGSADRENRIVAGAGQRWEFLTTITITVPPGTPGEVVDTTETSEADRARELARCGRLLRLWVLSGDGRALGLWWAHDDGEMQEILGSLPLRKWADVETIRLAPHPSDPGLGPR